MKHFIQPALRAVARPALRASAALAAAILCAAAAQADGKLAIKAGKIITSPGAPVIEKGVIVIENGRITAVGKDVKIPWDAPVIDAPEMTAFPGYVEAHSSRGMDRPNESPEIVIPFLTVRDSVDPVNFYFEDCLRAGITTINIQQGNDCIVAAQGMVVRPTGLTIDEMAVKIPSGLKLSATPRRGASAATQAQSLRRVFGDLRRYLEQVVQEKKDGSDRARREALYQGRDLEGEKSKGRAMEGTAWKVQGLELIPRGEIDEKQEPVLALVEGKMPAFIWCGRPADVHLAIEIARENGFLARTTLVIDPSCWKAADVISAAKVPVVLQNGVMHVEFDVLTGKEIETFVPKVLHDKKIPFALNSLNSTSQSLWFQAALCVGHGLPRAAALEAITTAPAKMLGLEKRVGSLEVGKDGNVLLLSGDPLSVTTWVERVVIEGRDVYDRSKDVRVQHLIAGKQPANTSAMGAAEIDPASVCCDGSDEKAHAKHLEEQKRAKDKGEGEDKKDEKKDDKKDEKKDGDKHSDHDHSDGAADHGEGARR
jgi:imidazolonepropionase-like amidohydrolase